MWPQTILLVLSTVTAVAMIEACGANAKVLRHGVQHVLTKCRGATGSSRSNYRKRY
jgi:hypothetical protein